MANYNLVAGATYNPLSYEELSKPLVEIASAHRAVEDDLSAANEKAEAIEGMIDPTRDPVSFQRYESFINNLRNQAGALSSGGLNPQTRDNLMYLKGAFASQMAPIAKAYDSRENDIKEQTKWNMEHPDWIWDNDAFSTSVDSYLAGKQPQFRNVSGDKIYQEGWKVGEAASKRNVTLNHVKAYDKDSGYSVDVDGQTAVGILWTRVKESEKKVGWSEEETKQIISEFSKGLEALNPELAEEYLSIFNANGLQYWKDPEKQKQAFDRITEGFLAGITYTWDKDKTVDKNLQWVPQGSGSKKGDDPVTLFNQAYETELMANKDTKTYDKDFEGAFSTGSFGNITENDDGTISITSMIHPRLTSFIEKYGSDELKEAYRTYNTFNIPIDPKDDPRRIDEYNLLKKQVETLLNKEYPKFKDQYKGQMSNAVLQQVVSLSQAESTQEDILAKLKVHAPKDRERSYVYEANYDPNSKTINPTDRRLHVSSIKSIQQLIPTSSGVGAVAETENGEEKYIKLPSNTGSYDTEQTLKEWITKKDETVKKYNELNNKPENEKTEQDKKDIAVLYDLIELQRYLINDETLSLLGTQMANKRDIDWGNSRILNGQYKTYEEVKEHAFK